MLKPEFDLKFWLLFNPITRQRFDERQNHLQVADVSRDEVIEMGTRLLSTYFEQQSER